MVDKKTFIFLAGIFLILSAGVVSAGFWDWFLGPSDVRMSTGCVDSDGGNVPQTPGSITINGQFAGADMCTYTATPGDLFPYQVIEKYCNNGELAWEYHTCVGACTLNAQGYGSCAVTTQPTHKICQQGNCITVSGAGADECQMGKDCICGTEGTVCCYIESGGRPCGYNANLECVNGYCVKKGETPAPTCVDNDGGINLGVASYIVDKNGVPWHDECISTTELKERACDSFSGLGYDHIITCPDGGTCTQGRCIGASEQGGYCSDNDNGLDTTTPSHVIDENGVRHDDSCDAVGRIVEHYCIGGRWYSNAISCSSGMICEDGACVSGPADCIPKTCEELGKTCGVQWNGCGGTVFCGGGICEGDDTGSEEDEPQEVGNCVDYDNEENLLNPNGGDLKIGSHASDGVLTANDICVDSTYIQEAFCSLGGVPSLSEGISCKAWFGENYECVGGPREAHCEDITITSGCERIGPITGVKGKNGNQLCNEAGYESCNSAEKPACTGLSQLYWSCLIGIRDCDQILGGWLLPVDVRVTCCN